MNEAQTNWLTLFRTIVGTRTEWEVFKDFIQMSACLISNTLDMPHAEQRESEYSQLVAKYSVPELHVLSTLQRMVYDTYQAQPDQDFLGPIYEVLKLGDDQLGQYFTPYAAARVLAQAVVASHIAGQEFDFQEPAGGSGALPIAVYHAYRQQGFPMDQFLLHVQDIDPIVAQMCYVQLSMIRCAAIVSVGDTLQTGGCGLFSSGEKWMTPEYLGWTWMQRRLERNWLIQERA